MSVVEQKEKEKEKKKKGEMSLLRVYADRISQPSRAILIFCKLNKINFEEVKIDLSKGQHRKSEYRAINPMGQVPSIVDGNFKLFESHAILRYLACAYPGVQDHWYPADPIKRAKVDSVLDWHHSNLRRGAAGLVFNKILAPVFKLPVNMQAASESEKLLISSLSKIESFWLLGTEKFLVNSGQPSIADLSLVCEIMQLEFLDAEDRDRVLGRFAKVKQWIEDTKDSTNPYFEDVHDLLYKAAARMRENAQVKAGGEGNQEMKSKL